MFGLLRHFCHAYALQFVKVIDCTEDGGCVFRHGLIDSGFFHVVLNPSKRPLAPHVLPGLGQHRRHDLLQRDTSCGNGSAKLFYILDRLRHGSPEIQAHYRRAFGVGCGRVENAMRFSCNSARECSPIHCIVSSSIFTKPSCFSALIFSSSIMGFVEYHNTSVSKPVNEFHPNSWIALDGLHLRVGGKDRIMRAQAIVAHHAGHQRRGVARGFQEFAVACRRFISVCFGFFFFVQPVHRILIERDRFTAIRHKRLYVMHPDVGQVAYHVAVQVGLLGDEDRRLAVLDGVLYQPGHDPALTNTGLVANNEPSAVADVVDGQPERVHLFGREVF